MGAHAKAKKNRDKDKWYKLAKDQGYRARSAFKLIQINKKFGLMDGAKSVIDLCAAPGGWLQVARKLAPQASIVLGFDLLPIKPIPGCKTFVQDITKAETRAIIAREIQGFGADVVLCDGAPNIGSAYTQDAFVQNALALSALKLATDVLVEGGSFVTKAFRSADYNKLMWAIKQLFRTAVATKPMSSRLESAEIFIVAQGYLAPAQIDPRLLSAEHVFETVDEDGDGGMDIFHKKFNSKRNRAGYDDSLGQTLVRTYTAAEFVVHNEPVKALSHANSITFGDEASSVYASHKATTQELRTCMSDLRVLGKGDFKRILKWRLAMRALRQEMLDAAAAEARAAAGELSDDEDAGAEEEEPVDPEAAMDAELARLRGELVAKQKRERKKRREKRAKHRVRLAMSEGGALELPGMDDLFTLTSLQDASTLDAMHGSDLTPAAGPASSDSEGGESDAEEEEADEGDEEDYAAVLENTLDAEFERYAEAKNLFSRRDRAKRTKKAKRAIAAEAVRDDASLYDGNMAQYAKLLTHGTARTTTRREGKRSHQDAEGDGDSDDFYGDARNDDSDSSDDDDDGEDEVVQTLDDEEEEEVYAAPSAGARGQNPLLVNLNGEESASSKAQRWFSNPLFASVDASAADAAASAAAGPDSSDEEEEEVAPKRRRQRTNREDVSEAERVLMEMPMTDKQRRKQQRAKMTERKERKEARRRGADEEDDDFQVVHKAAPGSKQRSGIEEEAHRKKIAAGFGRGAEDAAADADVGFEVVPTGTAGPVMPVHDQRSYGSDDEMYDDDDRAETLALAHMMMRKSKAKDLVDASYNRFAFNDPTDLPAWFLKDEENHLRPQLPIPQDTLEKMKAKFLSMSEKPIKKVAEARARKRKRLMLKVNAAKSKANAIANSSDISAREKLRSIEKTMRAAQTKAESKVYVVSRRGGGGNTKTPKGQKTKLVDARMKNDTRAQKRNDKKRGGRRKR